MPVSTAINIIILLLAAAVTWYFCSKHSIHWVWSPIVFLAIGLPGALIILVSLLVIVPLILLAFTVG